MRFDEEKLRGVEIYAAESRSDVEAALALTHAVYAVSGMIKPSPRNVHVTAHNAQPGTIIFVAKAAGRVVATTALVPDSARGLPLDALQRPALDEMRAGGLALCEATSTACDPEYRGSGIIFYLYRIMLHTALRAKFDRLVLSAQRKGLPIYEQLLTCERFSALAPHPALDKRKPCAALQLDLPLYEGRVYERFYGLAPYERTPHFVFFGKDVPQIRMPADLSVSAERAAASAALLGIDDVAGAWAAAG